MAEAILRKDTLSVWFIQAIIIILSLFYEDEDA